MGDTEISYAYVTAAVPVGALLMAITAMRSSSGSGATRASRSAAAESPL